MQCGQFVFQAAQLDDKKRGGFMKRFFLLVLVLVVGLAIGCSQKTATTQPEQPATVEKAVAPEPKPEPKQIETVAVKEAPAAPKVIAFENILFDFDKYNIRNDAKPSLKAVSEYLTKNSSAKMLLEGHCDERGTNEYNLALGEKRAKSARDYLVSLGVKKDRLETISYGEEKPLCTEKTESCWQQNRRVQFTEK